MLAASFEGRTLDMPILAIAGRHGVGTKLADGLRQQARNLTAVIAEDSGHFVAKSRRISFAIRSDAFSQLDF